MTDKTKILFVDDEKAYRSWFVREMRSQKAFLIETAKDGQDALEKLKSFPADMVMTDLLMPNMDGLELMRKIKNTYPELLVIIVTGCVHLDSAIEAMKLGSYDYILKPFDSETVKTIMAKAITHQRMQRDLRAVHERVRLLGDLVDKASYVMIFYALPNGRIIEFNAMAGTTFGYTKEELLSLNMKHLLTFNGGEAWERIARAVQEQSNWRAELTAVRKDGGQFPVDVAASHSDDEEDHGEHIICFVRDIRIEKEMNRMNSDFISVASYEMRTPLTSIKNAIDLIMAGKSHASSEMQEKFLSLAKRNIDRLFSLVNNLHDIYEIESGQTAYHFESADIKHCVDAVVQTFRPVAEKKSISLVTAIDAGIPQVYADTGKIEEVIGNLVGNAIKFTSENGTVTIKAQRVPNEDHTANEDGQVVKVSIINNGMGIPDQIIKLAFNQFYQAESLLPAEDRAGIGISLAICQYTVEAHGGRLQWKSEKAKGSTFSFTLPLANR